MDYYSTIYLLHLEFCFHFFIHILQSWMGGGDDSFTIASPEYIPEQGTFLNFEFGFFVTPFYIIRIWTFNFK